MGILDGKVVLVSGVGPGLGREIAEAAVREGARVGLAARSKDFLDEVAEALGGPEHAVAIPTDVTEPDQCEAAVAATTEAFGGVDTLVNSAFRPDVFKRFDAADLADWRAIFEVNVWGTLNLTKAALPALRSRVPGSSIVFIGSMVVRKPRGREGAYAASKGALLAFARNLAMELGPEGIRVNTVVPGWMDGPPVRGLLEWRAQKSGRTVEECYDEVAAGIPLREIPLDDDVANAVVFLASDLAKVITGQTLDTNGGEVMR